jgi:phosphate-selective porin OprO and OprP
MKIMNVTKNLLLSVSAISILGMATPAFAQSAEEVAALRAEVAALKAQLADVSQKVDAVSAAPAPAAVPAAPAAATVPETEIKWSGAPELKTKSGFSFKPRGRIQFDIGTVNAPNSVALATPSLGTSTEFRRLFLGVDGTLPGGFGYRAEADFANSSVNLTDVWLTYKAGNALITVGQQKTFSGLEEQTSDLFSTFQERAAFNSAFNFERRLGVSVAYTNKDLLIQGGVFSANANDLNSDANNSYSLDGRVVFSPKVAGGQLHLAGSAHYRDFNDASLTARNRARPFVHTTDVRFVDTRAFSSKGESSFGLEAAYIKGPFHATLEGHRLTSNRTGLADPTFQGGYAELGMMLTKGDSIGYKNGTYDRIKPKNPVGKGGIGALQLSGRYDYLDLNDAGITGGKQTTYGLSLIWVPIDYVRVIANYGHLELKDSAILAGTSRNYSLDTAGIRAQLDF